MAEGLYIPTDENGAAILPAAVYEAYPGIRPGQITSFEGLVEGGEYVLVGPGETVTVSRTETKQHPLYPNDPDRRMSVEIVRNGPDLFAAGFTIAALHRRIMGGFVVPGRRSPQYAPLLVKDNNHLVARGRGEETGPAYNPGEALPPPLLTYSQEDLGMKPYLSDDGGVAGWGVFYVRRAEPGEPHTPSYERRVLSPEQVVLHIPGTRLL